MEATSGELQMICTFLFKFECVYEEEGQTFLVKSAEGENNGFIDEEGVVLRNSKGGPLCSEGEVISGLQEFLSKTYVSS